MAKRFTDNEKWQDAWFMDLPSKYKLFWLYILDECNHAGIWKVNFKIASFHIGEHLEYSECTRILRNRINILSDEYWYIEKFIKYQYKCDLKDLNTKNKVHCSVIKLLNEYDYFKPLTSPLLGAKDKDKDMVKDINSNIDEDTLYNLDKLKEEYLKNDVLIDAFCIGQKTDKETIILKLEEFSVHLKSGGINSEKWNKYTTHFRNWFKINNKINNEIGNKDEQQKAINELANIGRERNERQTRLNN